MTQDTINQRIIFLVERLAASARAFSDAIGESPSNTHNYTSGGRKPKPEFLEKVLLHFRNVNAHWLLTGEGVPMIGVIDSGVNESEISYQTQSQNQKKNQGHIINHTGNGPASYSLADCQRDRAQLEITCESQGREIALLQGQVADKERTIQILLNHPSKP